jgi:hypothetical protein
MNLSQSEFAALIRQAGKELREPNGCTKRVVQNWESGRNASCRPNYRRALQAATGTPYNRLGFRDTSTQPPASSQQSSNTAPGNPSNHFRYTSTTPTEATEETVMLAQNTIARLFDADQQTPARDLLPTVARYLDDIATLLRSTHDMTLRRRRISGGGQAAALERAPVARPAVHGSPSERTETTRQLPSRR